MYAEIPFATNSASPALTRTPALSLPAEFAGIRQRAGLLFSTGSFLLTCKPVNAVWLQYEESLKRTGNTLVKVYIAQQK